MLYFDRYDITEAYYLALSHCHNGQWSNEYARLCKMQKYFKPSVLFSYDTLTENGKLIYNKACTKLLGDIK
jgi:negative regulator of genetic competence, sporulation and motility